VLTSPLSTHQWLIIFNQRNLFYAYYKKKNKKLPY